MKKILILLSLVCCPVMMWGQQAQVLSPDGRLAVSVWNEDGHAEYDIRYDGILLLERSQLGFCTNIGDFAGNLQMTDSHEQRVSKHYRMDRVKASDISYEANQLEVEFENADHLCMKVTFLVANNDVAFRYTMPMPEKGNPKCANILSEETSFKVPQTATSFICPQIGPMTGWERTKPSYEEEYKADEPVTSASKFGQGYTFPCLFKVASLAKDSKKQATYWLQVSETGVGSNYCASHLSDYSLDKGYQIAYPMEGENNGIGSAFASVSLPGCTPWRTITVGESLKPIVETTVAYDVVEPLYEPAKDLKPGRYTWSWLIWQDNSANYDDQVTFIDLAASLGLEYCLVDAWWDTMIGRERMAELSAYAQRKGVRLLLWYNSNGYSNDAPQGPRNCMNTAIAREREMAWMERIGIAGIKVDFFGSDKQETMRLYEDILSDANRHGLQVIFHGCTLPRGWERMYPNYVASEAALASENVFFSEHHAKREGFELTMHPFSRNAVAAFDWGGMMMNRYMSKDNRSRHPRYTSDVFELATGITNQTFIQCVAVQPNNLEELPEFELDFIRKLPTTWDETRFVDGYPTKYVVLARRHGTAWYVAGLNGTDQPLTLTLSLPMMAGQTVKYYTDNTKKTGEIVPSSVLKTLKVDKKGKAKVTIQPMGGIVLVN